MMSVSKSRLNLAFFIADFDKSSGMSDSMISVLILTMWGPMKAGIVADLIDLNCLPSPNLNVFVIS